jgi:hypothetical protein
MPHNEFDLGSKSRRFLKNGTLCNDEQSHGYDAVEEISVFAHPIACTFRAIEQTIPDWSGREHNARVPMA